jgi:hypothetical protein
MLIESALTVLFVAFALYGFARVLNAYRRDRHW